MRPNWLCPEGAVSSRCAPSQIIAHTCRLLLNDRFLRCICTCDPSISLFLSSWMPLTCFCSPTRARVCSIVAVPATSLPSLLQPVALWLLKAKYASIYITGHEFMPAGMVGVTPTAVVRVSITCFRHLDCLDPWPVLARPSAHLFLTHSHHMMFAFY